MRLYIISGSRHFSNRDPAMADADADADADDVVRTAAAQLWRETNMTIYAATNPLSCAHAACAH